MHALYSRPEHRGFTALLDKNGMPKERIDTYRKKYAAAVDLLSGKQGGAMAQSVLKEHFELPNELIPSVALVMREAVLYNALYHHSTDQ